ncbi:T-complex protein 1 [Basidiobolus meristosporus CBS 931.73]|uniref:CCT-theta n=1 Tax=Basidiobolus meristosporus CBS 931.73 TaxID=1314790 RepID=A0A1Y1XRY6_9FUNG|nr:T-complex protein 1 [Basidiobolus meristosporus CBS 931.73]|eukprot:ORX88529.1 T-complex protein 1 [Basidiobolus meristosporus CBS 931.73]
MALRLPKPMMPQLFKDGYKHLQGVDEAVLRNITAASELSEITRTSLGPNGRNKMVVNHLEKLFVTNDAATIIRELEVVHPAAKLLVMSSQQQEQELGDGTNLVVIFAGELLKKAEYLLRMGLHPSEIVQGYEMASKKALEYLDELSVYEIKDLKNKEELVKAVHTSIAAKQYGYEDLLSELVAEAALTIMPNNLTHFNVDNVRVVKIMGGSIYDSRVVKGMVFGRESEGNIQKAQKAKVAVFSCPIDVARTETKGTVLIKNADDMLNFSKGEEAALDKQIKEIADAGVKVIVTGGTFGDLALHFINRYEMMAVKVPSKFDLRRLCRVTGASAMTRLGAPMAEEMGYCDIVETVEIGSDRVVVFRQDEEKTKTVTIVIRGATQNQMDDIERAIDDGVNIIKAATKDGRMVPGAGAAEMELIKKLMAFGEKTPGLNQHAIKKYAEALEVVPRTLAENAGMDATNVLSKLYSAHHNEKTAAGVNVDEEQSPILDAVEAGILDSLPVKHWALRLGTSAALTVLNVDQIIMSKPAGGPKPPAQKANWDED